MKKVFLSIALIVCALVIAIGQNTQRGFSFQGIARDINGKALGSTSVDIQLSIMQAGSPAYTEIQTVTTDAFGVFALTVGSVTPSKFAAIDYSKDSKLKVEVKVGGTYSLLSETELLSVPYAKMSDKSSAATTAESATTAGYASTSGFPAGMIMAFGGPVGSIPTGWVLCDGRTLKRDQYSDLWNAIGTTWGTGDGATTFNVPDLLGMFLRGWSNGSTNDPDRATRWSAHGSNSGDQVGSYQSDGIRSHDHGYTHWNDWQASGSEQNQSGGAESRAALVPAATATTGGAETRPLNAYVMYIIKVTNK